MKILNTEQMREIDRRAVEEVGIPAPVLMENAASGAVRVLRERFPDARSAVIVCGPGNNGGDGLAMARWLDNQFWSLEVHCFKADSQSGECRLQADICRHQGLPMACGEPPEDGTGADLIIDALFGTGLNRPLEGAAAAWVNWINRQECPVVALDLPSGLNGSSEADAFPAVDADLTLAFCAPKVPHVLGLARHRCGEVVVIDIGVPRRLIAQSAHEAQLLEIEDLAPLVTTRDADAHKGTYGHLLIVATSPGSTGAGALAARGALRGGAGLVTVAVPCGLRAVVEVLSLESMTLGLPETTTGALGTCSRELHEASAGKAALVVGPGLGREAATAATVRELVTTSKLPLVLDADGLNAFSGHLRDLAPASRVPASRVPAPRVLTPHPGELARLLGVSTLDVESRRLEVAREAAAITDSVLVLKGSRTLIVTPAGEVTVNPTGNPGMATAGTGDVLAGLIGALLAAGQTPVQAARLAVFAHGLAGDLAAQTIGETGLVASDVVDSLPRAFEEIRTA